MRAESAVQVQPNALQELLERHFSEDELRRTLGSDSPEALAAARAVLQPVLSGVLARPGKEVRGRLVQHAFAIAQTVPGTPHARELPPELPAIVELLHAGSLVIDDIEDGAHTRRGGPAAHRVHGLPVALNAGNWLYFWPFALLARTPLEAEVALAIHWRVSSTLLKCHHGQAMDLGLRVSEVAQQDVGAVLELATGAKTGGLLELACSVGALAARASPKVEQALAAFGREAGVALQLLDDVTSILSPSRREKGEEDLRGGRLTWAWGLLATRTEPGLFRSLQRRASAVAADPSHLDELLQAMRAQLSPNDRRRARERIEHALAELERVVGASPALARLGQDLRALEVAFG